MIPKDKSTTETASEYQTANPTAMKNTLELLRDQIKWQREDMKSIEDKAKTYLGTSSLLITLFAIFVLQKLPDLTAVSPTYTLIVIGLAIALLAYFVGLIYILFMVLEPKYYSMPMKVSSENITSYWALDDNELIAQLTADAIRSFDKNSEILQTDASRVRAIRTGYLVFTIATVAIGSVVATLTTPLQQPIIALVIGVIALLVIFSVIAKSGRQFAN
jgi:hypothetical protein